jgi:hypothetical protein
MEIIWRYPSRLQCGGILGLFGENKRFFRFRSPLRKKNVSRTDLLYKCLCYVKIALGRKKGGVEGREKIRLFGRGKRARSGGSSFSRQALFLGKNAGMPGGDHGPGTLRLEFATSHPNIPPNPRLRGFSHEYRRVERELPFPAGRSKTLGRGIFPPNRDEPVLPFQRRACTGVKPVGKTVLNAPFRAVRT